MSNQDSTNSTTESTMLKGALVPTIIVGIACVALFSVLEGVHGFYGALVAQVVVVIFFLVHLVISKLSRNLDPIATMAFAMFSYFAKVMVVGAFLLIAHKIHFSRSD
jgi:ATP synthase protein I